MTEIKSNDDEDVIKGKISPQPDTDRFWNNFGKETINESLRLLDKRSQFMITTCAALIVGDAGFLIIAEKLSFITAIPQLILSWATICFVISYFPLKGTVNIENPMMNKNAYASWNKWKLYWQYGGYILFIGGLFAIAFTSLLEYGK